MSNPYIGDCLAAYRTHFDPAAVEAELAELDAEHTALYRRYADLPTPRAKEKAKAELAALEARIGELERHRDDVAGAVEQHFREVLDLQAAVEHAKLAMRSDAGKRSLRRRTEAVRAVVQRIECKFTATGKTGGGPGRTNARLATVTVYPVTGDSAQYPVESGSVLPRSSVVTR